MRRAAARKEEKALEYLLPAVDDHSERAYFAILPDETRRSCLKFLNALRFYRDHGVKVLRGMTGNGVSFRSLSSRKGVANVENQAQAHQALSAKNKRKGRTLRPDLVAGMGEAGQRFQQAKPVGMAGGGLCQTLPPFIRTGRRTCLSSTITIIISLTSASTDAPLSQGSPSITYRDTTPRLIGDLAEVFHGSRGPLVARAIEFCCW